MSDERLALPMEAIQQDLAAIASWSHREQALVERYPFAVRERGGSDRAEVGRASDAVDWGRQLLRRCGEDSERKLATLLNIEQALQAEHDYGALIVWASQLVESVLVQLLAQPLRPQAAGLIQALQVKRKDAGAAEVLTRWGTGEMPATLGTLVNLLLALRRAEEMDFTDLRRSLTQWFTPRYVALLRGNHLARMLNQVRDRYRNPAAHGVRTFDALEYEAFSRLVVAQARFAAWNQWGPEPPEPAAHEGVFHHHLAGYRWPGDELPIPAPTAVNQLLALQSSPVSAVRVQLSVEPDVRPRTRDVRFGERVPTFHLGMHLSIRFQSEPDAYGLLLDVGTSGSVAVLWPNRWDSGGRLDAGRPVQLPGSLCPYPLILRGATGEERLLGFAALDPWPQAWRSVGDEAFRELTLADVEGLLQHLRACDPRRWAVAQIAFRVER